HDAATVLKGIDESFRVIAAERSLQLELHCIGPEPPTIRADRDRLLQALGNLVGNAVKFTPEGGRVGVYVERAGDEVRFEVRDTGPGIPAAQLPHLFDRFWQARHSGRHSVGLGLSIAKGIVEAHGGRIWVESEEGAGARFFVTVPAAEAAAPSPESVHHGATMEAEDGGGS